ncbi:MAG: hypothetical protein Q8L48_00225 [Archangium sp.]|nr:hypothetical protein [Archangium sp.]
MRLATVLLLSACAGTPPAPDAGTDAGLDAGPLCRGVPARLTEYLCVEPGGAGAPRCEPTLAAAVAAHFTGNCDAGPGILGHLSLGECPTLESVRWVYGFPGDTYECFYERDGGPSVGGINFSDHGVIVAGQVGDCSTITPSTCRDGG